MAVTRYMAIASRDEGEKYWHVRIPGIGNRPEYGLSTQARSLAGVRLVARDLIALWLDAPAVSLDVAVEVQLPASAVHHRELIAGLRTDVAAGREPAPGQYRRAAIALKQAGFTLRDIGTALGVSHMRVQRLVAGATDG